MLPNTSSMENKLLSDPETLNKRNCPVCGIGAESASLFLDSSFDPTKLSATSFASRKIPEFMSYRLLRCSRCRTVYAETIPEIDRLTEAYSEAGYDSAEEAALAAVTYARVLLPAIDRLPRKEQALEIGTGTGVFLEKLLAAGFSHVTGIEPSRAAIAAADPGMCAFIREGVFSEADYSPESFDFICCFQTLEHVPDPRQLVDSCSRLLRPGGALALVVHDYESLVNRLLGKRSPIIDIEHLQIFCRASVIRLVETSNLRVEQVTSISNRYPLAYWFRLTPFPLRFKRPVGRLLEITGVGRATLGVNVGNVLVVARKQEVR